jgi:hypothetical protein
MQAQVPDELTMPITPAKAREHMEYLASDSMKGRNTPSPELDRAADYIAAQFQSFGLQPVAGSYFHVYSLERKFLDKPTEWILTTSDSVMNMELKEDFIPFEQSGIQPVQNAPLIFAGYGISAPEYGYDDYAGMDIRGKVVVIIRGEPQANNENSIFEGKKTTRYARLQTKIRTAVSLGAVGIIVLSDALTSMRMKPVGFPWPSLYPNLPADAVPLGLRRANTPNIPVIHAGTRFVQAMFGSIDSLKKIQLRIDSLLQPASAAIKGMQVQRLITSIQYQPVQVKNVMGWLQGESNEFAVIGAHYDHVGHAKSDKPGEDTIYNGADDNASGTTGMLMAAEAFAKMGKKPRRSMLFLAFSGEEKGLLGSKAFVDNPPLSLSGCVAMLNMDMIGRNAPDTLFVGGNTRCKELTEINEQENKQAFGDKAFTLQYTIENFFFRSDQASFALRKIPVIFYFTGEHSDYHKPGDEIAKINMEKLARIASLCTRTAWVVTGLPGRLPYTAQPGDDLQE